MIQQRIGFSITIIIISITIVMSSNCQAIKRIVISPFKATHTLWVSVKLDRCGYGPERDRGAPRPDKGSF